MAVKNAVVMDLRLVQIRDSEAPLLHLTAVDLIGTTVDRVRVCTFDTGAAAREDPKLSEVAGEINAGETMSAAQQCRVCLQTGPS